MMVQLDVWGFAGSTLWLSGDVNSWMNMTQKMDDDHDLVCNGCIQMTLDDDNSMVLMICLVDATAHYETLN